MSCLQKALSLWWWGQFQQDEAGICFNEVNAGEGNSNTWTWVLTFGLLVAWCSFACVMWMFWKKIQQKLDGHDAPFWQVENDIYYCWRQVAGEDEYIAQQASRIDTLHNQVMMYDGRLVETSENYAMDHGYVGGLHCAVVEARGFVRFPSKPPDLVSMGVQER